MAEVTVRELYAYPVKGCGGGPVEELVLTERGIEGDREYSFVGEDGLLVDQKKTPILASVSAQLSGRGLLLRHATQGTYKHNPRLEGDSIAGSWVIDEFEGIDQGDQIAEWVSNIIEKKVRLIRADQPWRINFPVPSMKRVHGKPKEKFTATSAGARSTKRGPASTSRTCSRSASHSARVGVERGFWCPGVDL